MANLPYAVKRDHAYLIVVGSSIALAYATRQINNALVKKLVSAAIGFAFAFSFCGVEVLYSITTVVCGAAIIRLVKNKHMTWIVFTFSFSYRIFFCILSVLKLWRDENNLANGIQLMLTIKLISVAYEVADFRKRCTKSNYANGHANLVLNAAGNGTNGKHKTLSLNEEPSFLDIVCYMYCFLGIGTGPFYRFRTYIDMVHLPKRVARSFPALEMIISRLPILLFLMVSSAFGGRYFSTDEMKSEDFYEKGSFTYRFFYVIPIGFIGMARYGVVWHLSEFGFTMAGLGVYPDAKQPEAGRGPTVFSEQDVIWPLKDSPKPIKYNLETIRNVHILRGLTSKTYAKTFRWWNCTVQWWLAHFVYASKLFSGKPSFIRWLAVATVSAVWHGFKAGYYFSFIGLVYVSFAEHFLLTEVGNRLSRPLRIIFDIIHYVLFKAIGVGSFMATFDLSSYEDIVRYLASVGYGIYGVATLSLVISVGAKIIFVSEAKPALKTD